MATLRERQVALARESIVDACAELVTERRHLDFAMKEVADRAGVSLRTVYNHFPTREDLLDALGQAFNDEMAARGGPKAIDLETSADLLRAIAVNFGLFDVLGGVSEAFAQMPLADVGRDEARRRRTGLIVDHLRSLMPEVPEPDATEIAVALRHLFSHRSWFWLTREYGLTSEQAAAVVNWAIETLIDAARTGRLPSDTDKDFANVKRNDKEAT